MNGSTKALLTFVILFFSYSYNSFAELTCLQTIRGITEAQQNDPYYTETPSQTIDHFIAWAKEQEVGEHPTFVDIQKDEALMKENFPGVPPEVFKECFPEGSGLITHSLFQANEPGVVKYASGGDFVSVRADVSYNGKSLPTNIGVMRQSLIDNINRQVKSFVSKDSKGVFIFMHGGGTRTTGHHVGINFANYLSNFGIDVISIDLPWHGEGPREYFKNAQESLEWIRSFIKTYVTPSGKPVFLGGHSMGGEYADLYMRHYDKTDGLVSGLINLSPPVDPLPGGTRLEKLLAGNRMWDDISTDADDTGLNVDDEVLGDILKNGKNSPMGSLSSQLMGLSTDWTVPEDFGANMIPTLWEWGKDDFLLKGKYFGFIEKYITPLKNSKVILYDDMGHLIFDRQVEGGEDFVAFKDVLEFMYDQLGLELKKKKVPYKYVENGVQKVKEVEIIDRGKKSAKKSGKEQFDFTSTVLREYTNILAFRQFTEKYVVKTKVAKSPEKLKRLSMEISEKNRFYSQLSEEEKLLDTNVSLKKEIEILKAKRAGVYIPHGPEGDKGRTWTAEREEVVKRLNRANTDLKIMKKENETAASEIKKLNTSFEELAENAITKNDNPKLNEAHDKYIEAYKVLIAKSQNLDKTTSNIIEKALLKGEDVMTGADLVPDQATYDLFKEFQDTDYPNFQKAKATFEEELSTMAESGILGNDFLEIIKQINKHNLDLGLLKGAIASQERAIKNMESVRETLVQNVIDEYNSEYYYFKSTPMREIFHQPYSEWSNYSKELQVGWSAWKNIWSDRPTPSAISLY
jgi:pimeloyl-ACP methyl ester carboxylesterase